MIHRAIQPVAGNPRRGFRWKLWAGALACLAVVACVGTSLVPRESPSDARFHVSPGPATGVAAAQLSLIPTPGSHVELQGTSTIGSWISRSTDVHGQIVLNTDAAALNAVFDRIQSAGPDGALVSSHIWRRHPFIVQRSATYRCRQCHFAAVTREWTATCRTH